MLFLRALLAFLALPVVVGGLLPWLLFGLDSWRTRGTVLGWPVFFLGMSVLLWCVRDFYVSGKGTLAPWDFTNSCETRCTWVSLVALGVGVLLLVLR